MTMREGVAGTMALARAEPDWEERLPMDAGAVFASFQAVALSLPAIVLAAEAARRALVALPEAGEAVAASSPVFVVVGSVVGALASWAASLFLLTRLASRSGKGWRVSPLIVAYNWSRLIANLILGVIAAAAILLSAWPIMAFAGLVKMILVLWFDLMVVRGSLALTTGQAAGAVAMVLLARGAAILLCDVLFRAGAGVFQV